MFATTYARRIGPFPCTVFSGSEHYFASPSSVFFAVRKGEVHVADTGTKKTGSGLAPQRCMGKMLQRTGAGLICGASVRGAYGLRIVYSQSFVPGTTDASDYFGHGTHVAGIVASAGWMSTGGKFSHTFKGIAPNANIINLRVLDQNGAGTDSSVIAAIQTAITMKNQYNIRVINLSLGRQVYESYTIDPLCQAVESAWKAGIVVVVAAGNQGRNNSAGTNGYGTVAAPGNDPYAITVGAMKTNNTPDRGDDTVASYSSKGPTAFDHVVKPDIVAPGNRVVSLLSPRSQLPKRYPAADVLMSEYADSSIQQLVTTYTGGEWS